MIICEMPKNPINKGVFGHFKQRKIRVKKLGFLERYVGSNCVQILQEDETRELIVMESWWESEYLYYKTDWLEIYN